MNPRFLLRLTTSCAVYLLLLSCFGTVLWIADEVLGWDILPDVWSLLVRALLIAGGIIAFVLVVISLLLSLSLLAEASASQAQLPNYEISRRFKRRFRKSLVAGVVAIALIVAGLQITDRVRQQATAQAVRAEFIETQIEMNRSLAQVVELFTPPLLDAIESNTLAEKGQLGNLSKLFSAVRASFPDRPRMVLLTPAAQAPYQYARIDAGSIQSNDQGQLRLSPVLYANFPSEQEAQVVQQLFAGQVMPLEASLSGNVINNQLPSSWGVLQRDGQTIAIVYLQTDASEIRYPLRKELYHSGPEQLITN
ncbi:MAG: hypothetical protein F6J97_02485 [Leptolyngbya sp. SIO4C1]|nr:hypothetical protein [Leptolyngbya sp. SIO4C1]